MAKKQHLREVVLVHSFAKNTAAEHHRLSEEVYGEHSLSKTICKGWFIRFKSGDFDIKDKEHPDQPKNFEYEELGTLLDQDWCHTQEKLAESMGLTQQAISHWNSFKK